MTDIDAKLIIGILFFIAAILIENHGNERCFFGLMMVSVLNFSLAIIFTIIKLWNG